MKKRVAIPNGIEKIRNNWFWGSGVESVKISASVREIGAYAFCNCKNLKQIIFLKSSQLEKIGKYCFKNSGLK